jgi:hypothetical protein
MNSDLLIISDSTSRDFLEGMSFNFVSPFLPLDCFVDDPCSSKINRYRNVGARLQCPSSICRQTRSV